jgi:hypothetical protein
MLLMFYISLDEIIAIKAICVNSVIKRKGIRWYCLIKKTHIEPYKFNPANRFQLVRDSSVTF